MANELLKLKWNGHLSSFLHIFQSLREKARYTDVTLACEGQLFTVHRLVLASCSQFFDHIFEQTPAENTVIILNEAKAHDIEALLDYMYCGQVDVQQSNLASFIRTAKCLQIKGLATPDMPDEISRGTGKRHASTDSETSFKRKRLEPVPSLQPSVLSPINKSSINRPASESPPRTCSPNDLSSSQNLWSFQRSDLPNTTWSTSQVHQESEGRENEAFRANSGYSASELHLAEEQSFNSSPRSLVLEKKLKAEEVNKESRFTNTQNNYYKETLGYHQDEEYQIIVSETKVKEEETEYPADEAESLSNPDYGQNYSYNTIYEREEPSETFSNSASSRKESFENQIMIDTHNIYNQNRNTYSLVLAKEIPPTTSQQATVSPKLMPYAKCSNCFTNNTKLWRRSMKGEIVCNACGLYYKLHGVNRPSHLFRNAPMTRRRNPRKKKKLYEEIAENREHNSTEDKNDTIYNESGCDEADTQDGLAVLNAALTLNSLFAKAKAQEAAAAAAAAAAAGNGRGSGVGPPQSRVHLSAGENDGSRNTSYPSQSQIQTQKEMETQSNLESSRPPPPLLKLHPSSTAPPSSHMQQYPTYPSSPMEGSGSNSRGAETSSQGNESPLLT